MVMQDINLRNFIVQKDRIYGIDFELCEEGCITEELDHLQVMKRET